MRRDRRLEWMRDHRQPALFVNGSSGLCQREAGWDRLSHPQREDVAVGAGHFYARHNLKRILSLLGAGPQAGFDAVMVGDGDHIELAVLGGVIEHLAGAGESIAQIGVHV
jgi:hypothetical protein